MSFFSQERLGIANSNYSTINSIFLNPSSSVDARTFIQLNLVGANFYFMNNQAYIPKFNVRDAIGGNIQEPQLSTAKLKKFLYSNLSLEAPACVVSYGNVGVGLFLRGRAVVDVRNVPYELTELLLGTSNLNTNSNVELNLRNVKLSQMSWVEGGANFSIMARKRANTLISVGGNLKYLMGVNVAYANLNRLKGYREDTIVDLQEFKGTLRLNQPQVNAGRGVGLDLGIMYKKMKENVDSYYPNSSLSNCEYVDYDYKIGVSLLDLGVVRYSGTTLAADVEGQLRLDNYKNVSSWDSLIRTNFSTDIKNNAAIWASLPTGLSAQVDYNLGYHFYANATLVKTITPASFVGVQRANLLSFSLRYERKNIEFNLPITLHRFIYPQVGFAFRFRTFVLGLDNILPLVKKQNTYGGGVYFNFGLSLFKNPSCWTSKSRHKRKKQHGGLRPSRTLGVDCPKF